MNLRKEDLLGIHKDRIKIGASLADVDPMQIDQTVCACHLNWTTKIVNTFIWLLGFLVQVRFDSIGGLGKHISALKEMVVFPLLYPEVFEKFKIQPPRFEKWYWQIFTLKCLFGWLINRLQKWEVMLNITFGRTHVELLIFFQRLSVLRPSWHRKDSGCSSPGKWVQSRREEGVVLHEERGRLPQQMGGRVWETAPPPVWPGFHTFHLKKWSFIDA